MKIFENVGSLCIFTFNNSSFILERSRVLNCSANRFSGNNVQKFTEVFPKLLSITLNGSFKSIKQNKKEMSTHIYFNIHNTDLGRTPIFDMHHNGNSAIEVYQRYNRGPALPRIYSIVTVICSLSLSLPVSSVSISISLSVSVSLYMSLLSLSLSVCLSVSVSLYICLSASLSISLALPPSLSLALSCSAPPPPLSLSLSVSLSLTHAVCLALNSVILT